MSDGDGVSMPTASLSGMPTEVIILILAHLDLRSIIRASALSRRFHPIVHHTREITYLILLQALGLVDNPAHSLPFAGKFDLLARHATAYNSLSPRLTLRIRLPLPSTEYEPGSTYELVDGIFARGAGLRYPHNHTTCAITFVALPSFALPMPQPRFWSVILPDPVVDFGIDPVQDLLVVIETSNEPGTLTPLFTLHFLTMRSAGSHPDARHRRVNFSVPAGPDVPIIPLYVYILHICGDRVGVLFRPSMSLGGHFLVVWDWRTGERICTYSPQDTFIASFAFLSPTQLLLCTSPDMPASSFHLDVVTLTSPNASLSLRFLPPPIEEGVELAPPTLRSSACPAPYPSNRPLTAQPILPPLPFTNDPSPEKRIFSLSLEALFELWHHPRTMQPQRMIGRRRYTLFAPASLFLSPPPPVLSSSQPDLDLAPTARTVPWPAWRAHCRFLDVSAFPSNSHVCHTHNWSHVSFSRLPPASVTGVSEDSIRLLEFPPASLPLPPRRHISPVPRQPIQAEPVFSEEVDTRLRAFQRERKAVEVGMDGCGGICVDGWERFVGVENGDEEDEDGRDVEALRVAVF